MRSPLVGPKELLREGRQSVSLDGKFVPRFKAGKELQDRVNEEEELV